MQSRLLSAAKNLASHVSAVALAICVAGGIASASAADEALVAAAKKEGEVSWYSSALPPEFFPEVSRAFEAKYPGIKLNIVAGTAGTVYQRLLQDQKMSVARTDVLTTASVSHFVEQQQKKTFAKYEPKNLAKADEVFRTYGEPGYYYASEAVVVGLAYNTNKVTDQDVPKSWRDLTNSKWAGKIALGHPAFSGSVAEWVVQMNKMYGWTYFESLEKLKPHVGRSVLDGVTLVVSGERELSPTLVGVALASAQKGNPIKVVYPEEGATLVMLPTAIMANAPHPNAAKLLVEFLFEVEYAEIAARAGYQPARSDFPPAPGSDISPGRKFITLTPQESTSGMAEVLGNWRKLFGN